MNDSDRAFADDYFNFLRNSHSRCHNPDFNLNNNYDEFIKVFSTKQAIKGIQNVTFHMTCEKACGSPCWYHLNLGKSITRSKFNKFLKHARKNPFHCLILKYEGDVKKVD